MAAMDAVEMEFQTSEDASRRSAWPVKSAAVALGVLGLVGVASTMGGAPVAAGLKSLVNKEQRVAMVPSYAACSAATENCFDTGCCKTSGHKCYMKTNGQAQCLEPKKCKPGVKGFTCEQPPSADTSVPVEEESGTSLYCFSLYSKDTGSQKKSYELELFRKQKQYGVSIFGCEEWDVFGDVAETIGDYTTIQVHDTNNEWHRLKRKTTGTWVNWGIFYSVWDNIKTNGKALNQWWTVKADADAVFIPQRLRNYISIRRLKDTPHGLYLENCKNVQYGYFGNLEVISRKGVRALVDGLHECHDAFAPCADEGCDWKFGPWGEDVFVQRCMDHHYVDKVEAFDLTKDGACASDRPKDQKKNKKWKSPDCSQEAETAASIHPFKKPQEYFKCMSEIMKDNYDV